MTDTPRIERAFGQKTVTLYRVEKPLWLTTATIHEDGDLSITSGDADNEWSLTVPAGRKGFVLDALLQRVTPEFPEDADEDDRLLIALAARYAGDTNPYEDIERFLRATNDVPRTTAWLDMP